LVEETDMADHGNGTQFDRRSVVTGLALYTLPVGTAMAGGAVSGVPVQFKRRAGAVPIIAADPNATFFCPMRQAPVKWRALHAFNPAAVVHDGAVYLLFRAEDDSGAMAIGGHTSRIGLARSIDGVDFQVMPAPVIYPADDGQRAAEWDGGCEDPRLAMREDGLFVCTYSQFNRKAVMLGVATSRDLMFWDKHGVAFAGSRYEKMVMKSAAIVQRLDGDRLVAAKIQGRYWMLFGQGNVYAAHSSDMIRWTPVESAPGALKVVMTPRPGKFDSGLVEAGPSPILTSKGIVMLYNGRNAKTGGDPTRRDRRSNMPPGAPFSTRAIRPACWRAPTCRSSRLSSLGKRPGNMNRARLSSKGLFISAGSGCSITDRPTASSGWLPRLACCFRRRPAQRGIRSAQFAHWTGPPYLIGRSQLPDRSSPQSEGRMGESRCRSLKPAVSRYSPGPRSPR